MIECDAVRTGRYVDRRLPRPPSGSAASDEASAAEAGYLG